MQGQPEIFWLAFRSFVGDFRVALTKSHRPLRSSYSASNESMPTGYGGQMPFSSLADVSIHYLLEGATDKPVLVLSHSLGSDLHLWDQLIPDLTAHHRVLRYDSRGHGESSVPDGPYSIEALAQDLLSLTERLGIERFLFCGLSMGGMLGIWLGIHAPERLNKLILANTAEQLGTKERWNDRISKVQSSGMDSIADIVIDGWFTPAFRQSAPSEVALVRARLATTSVQGYVACCAAIRDTDLTADVYRIQTPTLILSGAEDPVATPSQGHALQKQIVGAKYVELATSHLSAIEKPKDFSDAVLSFLRN
jgi:3-oxoadipate enol-lactonase